MIDTERLACDAAYRDAINDRLIESLGPSAFTDFHARPPRIDFKPGAAALKASFNSDPRLKGLVGSLKPSAFEALGDASRRLLDSVL